MSRCDHCPRPADAACPGDSPYSRRSCDLTDAGGPLYWAAYAAWLAGGPLPDPLRTPRDLAREAAEAGAGVASPAVGLAASPPVDPDALHAAETCPHRQLPSCGGCVGMECGPRGRRPGDRVTIRECLDCVAEHGPTPP